MTRLLIAMLLVLPACREEAALPEPVALTPEAVGHYCQMNLLEHPGPKAQVHLAGMDHPLFFSQVRDAIAFQRMPEQAAEIAAVYVNDMGRDGATWDAPGATNWVAAERAVFVVGSTLAGGMGAPETVPFADPAAAEAFAARHGGRLMALEDLSDAAVIGGTEGGAADEADYAETLRQLSGTRQE